MTHDGFECRPFPNLHGVMFCLHSPENLPIGLGRTRKQVLDSKAASFASDMYSLGVVVWEVLTTIVPWADAALGRDIYLRVVIKGDRLEIPAGTPEDMAAIMRDCWVEAPGDRPSASEIAARIRPHGGEQD